MRYNTVTDNRWVYPRHNGFRSACCDCGLVHSIDFRIVDGPRKGMKSVKFRVYRNNRATAAMRRGRK